MNIKKVSVMFFFSFCFEVDFLGASDSESDLSTDNEQQTEHRFEDNELAQKRMLLWKGTRLDRLGEAYKECLEKELAYKKKRADQKQLLIKHKKVELNQHIADAKQKNSNCFQQCWYWCADLMFDIQKAEYAAKKSNGTFKEQIIKRE